jgi:N-acetylmuramoyl-L-alanine amidase
MKKTICSISLLLLMILLSMIYCNVLFADGSPDLSQSQPPNQTGNTHDNSAPTGPSPIQIIEPAENEHIPGIPSTFVYGSVPVGGKLWINGIEVPVYSSGGFITMIQLSPGPFQIKADLKLGDVTYHLTRNIQVGTPVAKLKASDKLIITDVSPSQDQELLPGDNIDVVCQGTPGKKAYFTVQGVHHQFPMLESSPSSGIYRGVYLIGEHDKLKKSKFTVTLEDNHKKVTKESTGTLSIFPTRIPVMTETISPDTVLRTGPALTQSDKAGYLMFPPVGTLLQLSGKKGEEYRVKLTKTKSVWVSANQVKLLPEGTLPAHVVIGGVGVTSNDRSTMIRLSLGNKIPFKIEPDVEGKYIDVSFYGAYSNTDLISNPVCGIVTSISWFQDDDETYRLRIFTNPKSWWGYDPRFEGNDFVLELRTPPSLPINSRSALDGLTIAIDAGHGLPDTGAIGNTGYMEKDANLALAQNLKQQLLAKGAQVVMIRTDNNDVPLADRPRIAWQNKADILISVHNNALPYGGNPFLKHGFGVYYFTPMSLQLANEVHSAYCQRFVGAVDYNLPDDGLYYDNLALTRSPQMPSILTESAYMIVPEEEAYLKTDGFRNACAGAIVKGLESYASSMRPITGRVLNQK